MSASLVRRGGALRADIRLFGLLSALWLVAGLTFLSGLAAALRMRETT